MSEPKRWAKIITVTLPDNSEEPWAMFGYSKNDFKFKIKRGDLFIYQRRRILEPPSTVFTPWYVHRVFARGTWTEVLNEEYEVMPGMGGDAD